MTKVYDYPSYILKPAIGQEEAYEIMGIKNVLESFLFADEDACIIAYGQTGNIFSMKKSTLTKLHFSLGSGKTHTMFGDGVTRDEIRFVEDLFVILLIGF